jgi:hypothetical protein
MALAAPEMAVEHRLHLEAPLSPRHCEEQRDEAIQTAVAKALWIASLSLAMTVGADLAKRRMRAAPEYCLTTATHLRIPPTLATILFDG